jgi:hypothetical protein
MAVEEAVRVADGLAAEGFVEFEVGEGHGDVFGHGDGEALLGFGDGSAFGLGEVEDAECFGLSHHGDAEVAVGRGLVEVLAEEAGVGVFDPVDAAAAEAPAFLRGEDAFDESGLPQRAAASRRLRRGDDVEGADLDGEDLLRCGR